MATSSSRGALVVLALGISVVACGQQSQRARQVLERSMQRTFAVNVVAIISQRDPMKDGRQKVKIERDRTGRIRKSVLQPLHLQGVQSVDNGERWVTVLPDDRLIIDHESPLRSPDDCAFRMQLAQRNYTFQLDDQPVVAGRKTLRVVATPKASELEIRRFYIDAQTNFPLKMETVNNEGDVTVNFVTLDVRYPSAIDPELFSLPRGTGMNRIRYASPTSVLTSEEAKEKLGFPPILPAGLPLGFKVHELQVNDTPDWRSLAVRLTDGLVRATVYEYRASANAPTVRALDDSTHRDIRGIRLLLVTDLSESIRLRLLNSFIALAMGPGNDVTIGQSGHSAYALSAIATMELFRQSAALAEIENIAAAVAPESPTPIGRSRATCIGIRVN